MNLVDAICTECGKPIRWPAGQGPMMCAHCQQLAKGRGWNTGENLVQDIVSTLESIGFSVFTLDEDDEDVGHEASDA